MVDYTVVLNVVKKNCSNSSFILKYPCSIYTSTCTLHIIYTVNEFKLKINLPYIFFVCLTIYIHIYLYVQ